MLEWVAISFSRGSSQPRDQTQVSCIVGRCFTVWATREVSSNNLPLSKVNLLFIWMFTSSHLRSSKDKFFTLSFSLWNVRVWGMENGGGQRREGKAVGSLTRHILWQYLWKTFYLSFMSFQPISKVHARCPLSLCFFLGEWLPLNGCFTITEYRYPWNSGSGSVT